MKNAKYQGNLSCPQRDSAEHEGHAGAQSVWRQEVIFLPSFFMEVSLW